MTSNKLTVQKALFESQGLITVAATCLEGHKLLLYYPAGGSSTILLNIDAYIPIHTAPQPAKVYLLQQDTKMLRALQ